MRQLLTISMNDLVIFLKARSNLISLIVIPVIMTLAVGLFTAQRAETLELEVIDIVDLDRSQASEAFLDALRSSQANLLLCPMDNTSDDICQFESDASLEREAAVTRVGAGISTAAVILPADLTQMIREGQSTQIEVILLESSPVPTPRDRAIRAAVQQLNAATTASTVGMDALQILEGAQVGAEEADGLQERIIRNALQIWASAPSEVKLAVAGEEPEYRLGVDIQDGFGQSVPGMGTTFVMFTVFGGMTALIAERKHGTLQRLATSPIRRSQLMGGKIFGRFSLGMLQYLVVFLVGVVVGISFGNDPIAVVLVMISFTLAITALSFALGSRLENESQSSGLSLLLSMVLAPLGGAWWPLEVMPEFMQVIAHISPVAWAMDAYNVLISGVGSLSEVWLSIAVLMGMAILFFSLGVRSFKYQ